MELRCWRSIVERLGRWCKSALFGAALSFLVECDFKMSPGESSAASWTIDGRVVEGLRGQARGLAASRSSSHATIDAKENALPRCVFCKLRRDRDVQGAARPRNGVCLL